MAAMPAAGAAVLGAAAPVAGLAGAAARRAAAAPPGGGEGRRPMSLEKHDEARIEAAIRDCERATGGQIVCVLAESAMVQRTALPVLLAAVAALGVPWLLVVLTQLPVLTVLLLQALTFVVLLALA